MVYGHQVRKRDQVFSRLKCSDASELKLRYHEGSANFEFLDPLLATEPDYYRGDLLGAFPSVRRGTDVPTHLPASTRQLGVYDSKVNCAAAIIETTDVYLQMEESSEIFAKVEETK